MSSSTKSSNSPRSSNTPSPSASRPYSFRPQDFGAPERNVEGTSANLDRIESDGQDAARTSSEPQPDVGAVDSAGRANIRSGAVRSEVSHKVQRKEEHTILMAVPPPAQENKGV